MTLQESQALWERFKKLNPAIQRDLFCWLWGWVAGNLQSPDHAKRLFAIQTFDAMKVHISHAEVIAQAHKTETTTP